MLGYRERKVNNFLYVIKKFTLIPLLLAGLFVSPAVFSDTMELEVIDLRHRSAEEVVPIVKPFVINGGSVTGRDYKLIIRSTPQNLEEIRQLLGKVDTALRELTVYVSTDYEAIKAEQSIAARGRIGNDSIGMRGEAPHQDKESIVIEGGRQIEGGARGGVGISGTRSRSTAPSAQTIRVQEGQWATIHTGQTRPIREQITNPDGTVTHTTRYQNVTSGFQIRPQLNGEQVQLFIRPQRASVSNSGKGQINVGGLETTVSTRLGEWVDLGGTVESRQSRQRGITHSTRHDSEQRQRVFVKIELQP